MYKVLARFFVFALTMALVSSSARCGEVGRYREEATNMKIVVDGVSLDVEWENNRSVNALKEILPLSVNMHAYGGFEQVGELGRSLSRDDKRITTSAGDIVLYSGNQIVIFYGSNTWAYTRLGRITGKSQSELASILGGQNVTLTIEQQKGRE